MVNELIVHKYDDKCEDFINADNMLTQRILIKSAYKILLTPRKLIIRNLNTIT